MYTWSVLVTGFQTFVLPIYRNRAQCYLLDALTAFSQPVRLQNPLDPPDNYLSIEAFRTLHIPVLLCSRSPQAICFPQMRPHSPDQARWASISSLESGSNHLLDRSASDRFLATKFCTLEDRKSVV